MNNLKIIARFEIHDGKLPVFKKLAKECISLVNEKDRDTLQYDWFFNQDQTQCVIIERYTDSNALLAHLGNISSVFGGLLEQGNFSAEV
ncbi:putative quinol monooxygenase [Segetibacter koreensis]|uniref:putative quinol monooxygenase n=1 Tax=Segetibacter koreensis TaxID=398037 RepID=UPI00036C1709|nr:antibiotic biosynthesis monooxygenase [Segetibacter koreensis]